MPLTIRCFGGNFAPFLKKKKKKSFKRSLFFLKETAKKEKNKKNLSKIVKSQNCDCL